MEVDDDSNEIDGLLEQFSGSSQSQTSSQRTNGSQRMAAGGAPPIPQSNVGNRRHRRDKAEKDGQKIVTSSEPGFGNPLNIQKNKRILLDGLRHILAHKKTAIPSKKDAFNATPLDKIDEVAEYLELSETGELLRYSSMVYGLRVDTTYNDAMSTNCQLQPNRMKSEAETGKKSKAEQKLQQSTATQSLNLQKLQCEMDQDAPEDEQNENATPSLEDATENGVDHNGEGGGEQDESGEGGGMEGMGSDGDEDDERREAELTEEQRAKVKDSRPIDTSKIKFSSTAVRDIIAEEFKRRHRNLDRKCDLNPMLMDDERKFRMAPAALLTNEYYQIATARYKELNASGMLAYNAKVTHNGRMTLMHKRMDAWKDADALDHTPPTQAFRKALSGLVDNAMREGDQMHVMPNYLFDTKDVNLQSNKLTTGLELADIEKKTREKILHQTEFDFLDKDDNVIHDDDDEEEEREETPSPLLARKQSRASQGVEEGQENSQPGPSRSNSLNPSTPAAETEASEASNRTTPKAGKERDEDGHEMATMSQAEIDDYMEVMSAAPRKRKFRKASALTAVLCEDEIKNGPILCVDDLASKFQQILFDKVTMGSKVEWERGANCEELQADPQTVNEECLNVEKGSTDMDLMHLDRLWTSKYYKRVFTMAEVRDMKDHMRKLMNDAEIKNKLLYFKPGEYEFIGEDDDWTNPEIPPDEHAADMPPEQQPLFRILEDRAELERLERVIAAEEDSDDDGGGMPDDDDERIVVGDADVRPVDDPMDDFFMSDGDDEQATSSTTGEKRTDFTAGDDQRLGELADVNGMLDPTFVSDIQPSAAVRGTGKADDSHWKGAGNVEKPKKERKRKNKEEEEPKSRPWFECEGDILDRKKIRTKFTQATRNVELMKETDQLLMPVQVNIVPQMDYDIAHYYKSFFLPELLPGYVAVNGSNNITREEQDDGGMIHLDASERLEHYTAMLDSSMTSAGNGGEDVFLSFMRMFRNYTDVTTQREIEVDERVRSGELAPEEAAAELASSQSNGGMGGGGADDYDDFGGGGGFDDDFGGAMGGGEAAEAGPFVPNEENTTLKPPESRALSQARSIALASTHGYGMRVANSDDGDEEGDAYAKMGDREYHLRLIKLDTVAMKTALSDVLTNPLMVEDKLNETLCHFNRVFPTQQLLHEGEKKRKANHMQTINEDEEMDVDHRDYGDDSREEHSDWRDPQEIINETVMEMPDAMNVTRALFAPVKEKAKPTKTMTFGAAANSSQNQSQPAQPHIELNGHHTLKSTFTCLPARLPLKATSDVTVASTISMILHLANEHNLILDQEGQNEGLNVADGNSSTTTYGDWMNDFAVHCLDDDAAGTKMAKMSKRISAAAEVLQQLSADEDASDAEKRQKQLEKTLAEMAEKQRVEREEIEEEERREAEEERKRVEQERKKMTNGGAARRRDMPGTSSDVVVDISDDDIIEVEEEMKSPVHFKAPAPKRGTPRKATNDDKATEGPSTKRTRRSGNMDETIVLDD